METGYWVRLVVFWCFIMVMAYKKEKYHRAALIAWRILNVCSVLDAAWLIGRMGLPGLLYPGTYTIYGIVICLIVVPLLFQMSTCRQCGRRVYWHGLISSRCPHCKERIY